METARTSVSTAAEAGDAEYYDYAEGINKQIKNFFKKKKVLKPVPDHSEEMLSVLSEVMRFKHELRMIMSDKLQYPDNFLKALTDAEQLINKVKDNGK